MNIYRFDESSLYGRTQDSYGVKHFNSMESIRVKNIRKKLKLVLFIHNLVRHRTHLKMLLHLLPKKHLLLVVSLYLRDAGTASARGAATSSLRLLAILNLLEGGLGGHVLGLHDGDLALVLEIIDRHTNNTTSYAKSLADLLSGNTLLLTLLVHLSPGLGPHELSGLLLLSDHAHALVAGNKDGLSISADKLNSVSRVDSELRECTNFRSKNEVSWKGNEAKRKG